MIDDRKLLALLDGELDAKSVAEVQAAAARDPSLANRLEHHRGVGDRLRASFANVLDQPVPASLAAAAGGGGEVVDLAAARSSRLAGRSAWTGYGALAASLAAGLVGGYVLSGGGPGPVAERDGSMIASGDLGHALDAQLASAGAARSTVRVQLSFRDRAGEVCRSFAGVAASGVACRQGGRWLVKGLFPGEGEPQGVYRVASSGDPRVMQMVGAMIDGEPFNAAQERAARAGAWRAQSVRPSMQGK